MDRLVDLEGRLAELKACEQRVKLARARWELLGAERAIVLAMLEERLARLRNAQAALR